MNRTSRHAAMDCVLPTCFSLALDPYRLTFDSNIDEAYNGKQKEFSVTTEFPFRLRRILRLH